MTISATAFDPDEQRKPATGSESDAPASLGRRRNPRNLYRLWFALPSIVLVLYFFFVPFVLNGGLSLMRWTAFSSRIRWIGLGNYETLQKLGILGHATKVTVIYALVTMAGQNVAGLLLAKAMQRTNRVNSVFRAIYFLPVLISPLAAGYIWAAALADHGPLNAFLSVLLPGSFAYSWLGHSVSALLIVGLIDAWKWSGIVTLVYISGLNSLPRSVTEAAVLDGVGPWRRFWSIEFPLLAPAFTFNVVLTLVGSFNALDVVFATTRGGPGDATAVLNVAVYNQYGQGFFGTSSALSFTIALMVIFTAVPLLWWLRKREVHG